MTNPQYTFLLPAYKATFFKQALESIRMQTYPNFKCIVSDDCSPEDLKSIFDTTVGDDSRFLYRRNTENMGKKSLVSHWNMLVDMCDTEYLIMASDDDVYEPIFLAEIDALTDKYPDVNLFRGRAKKIDANNEMLDKDILLDEFQNQLEFLYVFCYHNLIQCVAHYVFRTAKFKEQNSFVDIPWAWGSDRMAAIMMSKNGVCNSRSIVFSFRISDIHISAQKELSIRREKTRAQYLYMKFLERTIPNLSLTTATVYEKVLFQKINKFLNHNNALFEIYFGALRCPYKEMKRYYKYLNHMRYFPGKIDKIRFFVRWIFMYKSRMSA